MRSAAGSAVGPRVDAWFTVVTVGSLRPVPLARVEVMVMGVDAWVVHVLPFDRRTCDPGSG